MSWLRLQMLSLIFGEGSFSLLSTSPSPGSDESQDIQQFGTFVFYAVSFAQLASRDVAASRAA
jgi:hypothetical protein